jgi:4-amino-4-deoxy-L-arabinose transferase-like glycosyltransferase
MTQSPDLRRRHVIRDLALIFLVVIASSWPFLSQPFHMDDAFYMDMARSARAHPLYPLDTPYDFGGYHVPDMASHSHPPLQTYFLAVLQRLAGEGPGREWIYHSVALLFPLLAAISLYFLASRFVERPLWPSLAMAVCPLFMVMAHTLMTDIPMLAFWLAAIACFLWATERKRTRLYLASSFFQFAAMFTSYQAISLFPLLAFCQIRRRGRPIGWLCLTLPVAALGSWIGMTSLHYGRMVLGNTVSYVQYYGPIAMQSLAIKAIAVLEYQGWLLIFPLFLVYIFGAGLKGRLFFLFLLGSIYAAQVGVPEYRFVDKAIFVVGLTTGGLVSARMLALLWRAFGRGGGDVFGLDRIDAQFVALWYFGVAAYCLLLFTSGSARYILPLVPAVLIFFFRWLEIREVTEYRAEREPFLNSAMVASGSLVLSLVWGLFLSQADFEFARIYPRAAAAVARMAGGLDTYITGEWGFRYYFVSAGARPLPADESSVAGGSLLVKPDLAMPYDAPADLSTLTLPYGRLSFDLKTPFRVMDRRVPAGFYSTGWGLIPFSLSNASLENLEIRQVSFLIERLPWAAVATTSGVMPWPGFAPVRGNVLALLAKPGTRIRYPWTLRSPAFLKLDVGVLRNAAEQTTCAFEILHRDGQGRVLARIAKISTPEAQWQPVEFLMAGSAGPGEILELAYSAATPSDAVGAFAGAILVPK